MRVASSGAGTRQVGRAVLVLVLVRVELRARDDLARERRLRRRVAEDRDLDLTPFDRLLGDDPLVELERRLDRRVELGLVVRLAHADRRSHVRGLDEARQPELRDDPTREHGAVLAVAQREVVRLGHPAPGEHALHHHLVHGDRGAEHPRSDVRQVRQVEQPLDRPVLPVGTVEQREDDVDPEAAAPGRRHDAPELVELRALDLERGGECRRVVGDELACRVRLEPPAVAGDRHGHDLVALGVERARHGDRGSPRDVVLRGPAPEHEHHARAGRAGAHDTTCSTARIPSPMMKRPPSP